MAVCPKCGYKLKITDWRPECPSCGVNLVYYGMEDRLREEADKAELEHAKLQPIIDRIKASLIGTTLAKVRILFLLLPVLAMFLPMGKVIFNLPFMAESKILNIITAVKIFIDYFDFNRLLNLLKDPLFAKETILFAVSLFSFALVLILFLLSLIFDVFSCTKHGVLRNIIIASIGIADSLVFFVSLFLLSNSLSANYSSVISVKPLWGFIGLIIGFAAIIAINVIYVKKGYEVKYTDVSELMLPYNERPSVIAKKQAAAEAAAAASDDGPEPAGEQS